MKRVIAILTISTLMGPVVAAAQSSQSAAQPQPPASTSLVDVAKAEEARRKNVRKPAKVYTNGDLKPDNGTVRPAPTPPVASAASANATPGVPVVNLPGGSDPAAPKPAGDQAYWSEKISSARAALERSKVLADALQSRINALTTDFVNRDDPAQRAVIENDRKTALAELERTRKEIDANQKAITAIEDEARRAGVPSGWLRPGA
jgi:hypothetical protein